MDIVETVARAIAQADEQNGGPSYDYRIAMSKHAKEQLFDQARAAISAMAGAAAQLEHLEKIVSRARSILTYPVSSEIDTQGYAPHSPNQDRWDFLVETLLPSPQQQEMK